ncbi:MAG: hypothetical protein PHD21_00560 [Flavobacteriales bacterium]|nr:hypothetical protein [Flavobacteriales bacterium]
MSGKDQTEETLRCRKKIFTSIVRTVLGLVFVFSALVKLNDPMGLSFKIEDYLATDVLNMPFFSSFSVTLSIAMIALELILGICLLLGRFKIFTLWALFFVNMGFMSLTLYSAITGKVTDCGCFGDAVHLGPWTSFFKNVVIFVLIVLLIAWQRFIRPIAGFRTSMSIVAIAFAFAYGTAYYVLRHEPFVDFRPYKIGVNIPQASSIPDGAPVDKYKNVWSYRVGGEVKKYSDEDEPWNIAGAEFVSRTSRLVKKGYTPAITNFSMYDAQGEDMTDYVMSMPKVFIILCYDFSSVKEDIWQKVKTFTKNAVAPVVILSNASEEKFNALGINVPVYNADAVTIKTVMRSNPGILELENGTIVLKYNLFNQ